MPGVKLTLSYSTYQAVLLPSVQVTIALSSITFAADMATTRGQLLIRVTKRSSR